MFDLFGDKPWFRQKTHGYGAGMPIVWQGWVLLGSYMAAIIGLGIFAQDADPQEVAVVIVVILLLTALLLVIAWRHTEGGWRWRWGADD